MEKQKRNEGFLSSRATEKEDGESWHTYHDDIASKLLLDKLKKARGLNDLELLQIVVQQCKAAGMAELKSVVRAERQMKLIEMKAQLVKVVEDKDMTAILETIDEIKKLGFDEALMQHEVIAANNVVERLRHLAELKYDILNMDRRTMSEMRSYNNPPEILQKVLQASFLLLGEDERTTSRWKVCRTFCMPSGPDGLQRKFLTFDVSKLHPEIVARCKQILDKYTVTQVQRVSAGAGTFYVWARGIIDESDKQNPGSGAEPAKSVLRQRELLELPEKRQQSLWI
ncbi:hypothetical protein NP493_527g02003 [Ridgeia piscesae]|uniref:Uncharacterized protein n=1 Tax=Ridgeia piscesae TaxID=27915 RepID=A0AAD9KXX4_RIDPI|nr:hypothetical protein NP493_527g02003 [Ridgeia piscesae]